MFVTSGEENVPITIKISCAAIIMEELCSQFQLGLNLKNKIDVRFDCHLCTASFKKKRYLNRHLYRKHKVFAKKFGCYYCQRKFRCKSGLEAHAKMCSY